MTEQAESAPPGPADPRGSHTAAYLAGVRATLECVDLREAARRIFLACQDRVGAHRGLVGMRVGDEVEVLFATDGAQESQRIPPRISREGIRGRVLDRGQTVVVNDLASSPLSEHVPTGVARPFNVLMVPLKTEARVDGLVILADKPGGFSDEDARSAEVFAALVAVALAKDRQAEAEHVHEQRYREILETAQEGLCSLDIDSTITFVNERCAAMLGRRVDELVGHRITEFLVREDVEVHRRDLLAEDAGRRQLERRFQLPDGSVRSVVVSTVPLRDAEGRVSGAFGTFTDATPMKAVERALRESEARLQALFDAFPEPVYLKDRQLRYVAVNRAMERRLERRAAEIVGRTELELLGRTLPELDGAARRALQGEASTVEVRHQQKGAGHYLQATTAPVHDDQGVVVGVCGTTRDVTVQRAAEDGLKSALADLSAVLDASPDGILVLDNQRRITRCNERFLTIWGYPAGHRPATREEGLAWAMNQVVDPTWVRATADTIIERAEESTCDLMELKDGRVLERLSHPQRVDGVVVGRVFHFRDVTDRVRAARVLQERETQFRALVENSPDLISRFDRDGRLLYLNPMADRFFQSASARVLGRRIEEFNLPGLLRQAWRRALDHVVATSEEVELEFGVERQPGEVRFFNATVVPEMDERGQIQTVLAVSRDVTAQRQMERDYRTLFNGMLDGFALFEAIRDPRGELTDMLLIAANPAFERISGLAQLVGRRVRELLPTVASRWLDLFKQVAHTGRPVRMEGFDPVFGKHVDATLLSPRGGQFALFLQDISARKRSEQALQESEARYRSLFADSHTVMVLVEAQTGAIIDANGAACAYYGYPREELLQKRVQDFDPTPASRIVAGLAAARAGPQRLTATTRLGTGELREVEVHLGPIHIHGMPLLYAIVHDVTEQRRAEVMLRRLYGAIEQTSELVALTDEDGRIEYVNPALEALIGYAKEEAVGKPLSFLHEGQRPSAPPAGPWMGTLKLQRKSGAPVDVEASVAELREPDGRVTGYVAVHRDITDRHRLERQLRQAQKMEALGTLAGGIAHDFNNILAAIMGFATLAQNQLEPSHSARADLQEVVTASHRARDLVRQILAFSRRTEHHRSPLQVSVLAKEALKLLRASLPTTIEIRTNLSESDDYVLGDPTQIHQIVMNLCTNAAHAMRERGGLLTVSCGVLEVDAALATTVSGLRAGSHVRLRVQDTGHGMDAATVERVFEPYFTTKGAGEGTGLGLPVVHGIVTAAGGAVALTSEVGRGTTVDVFLPRHLEVSAGAVVMPAGAPRGQGRVLLVDDEPALARFGKQCLEGLGYTVVAVTSSSDALDLIEEDPEAFDLVVTDQTMPHMTGLALAREVHELRPELPILLCTGYSEAISPDGARSLGVRQVLLKPLPPHELAQAVAMALRGG